MPRRRYYRRPVRVVAAKKKWATNITSASLYAQIPGQETNAGAYELCVNSQQATTPTPVIVKTGNFKIQGDCYVASSATLGSNTQLTLYVMYLPEGMGVSTNTHYATLVSNHPEWIMAWKVLDMTSGVSTSNGTAFSFSSRLKRNLNSGDSVALVAVARNGIAQPIQVTVNFTAQYWTCAN